MTRKRKTIFVIVRGGVAEVDSDTVPEFVDVEVIDLDTLGADAAAAADLSPEARAYAKAKGYL